MKIQIRYAGTTKTAVITYEIYGDGDRIGIVKMNVSQMWHATQWMHKPIGNFAERVDATRAVIENYRKFRKECTKRQGRTFDTKAVKLK